jgi:hypothetical protein
MKQAKEENKQLRNFKWLEDKRPKTKFELFEDIKKPVIIKDSTGNDSTGTGAVDSTLLDSLKALTPQVPIVKEQPKAGQPKQQSKQPVEQPAPPADKKEQVPFRKKKP